VALRVFAHPGTEALAIFVSASATMQRMLLLLLLLLLLASWDVNTSGHRRRLDRAESVERAIGAMGELATAGVSTA
jgi:hypothetical protein